MLVTATGDMRYTPTFNVDFLVPQGYDFPLVELDLALLRGTSTSASVTTIQQGSPGSILYDPIPARFFEVYTGAPAAVIHSNGVKAACVDALGSSCKWHSLCCPSIVPFVDLSNK